MEMLKAIDTRTQEAVTLSIVNAGCLWWLTWMQFVTAEFFGLPIVSFNPGHCLWYYVTPEGWPTNLPRLFQIVTVMAVFTLFLAMPAYLTGSKGKGRQVLLVSVFSMIAIWFSSFIARYEGEQFVSAKNLLEWYRSENLPYWAQARKELEVKRLETVIGAYMKSKPSLIEPEQ
ncbi:MAG: hypothetical protein KDM63_18045 [Verrucomicrobiae bacterium]|nr:hypothetical protein [Verrucomicrobiae bacterium]